jgi:HK97 family phage major capsid protein
MGAFAATWTTTSTTAATGLPTVADLVTAAYKLPTPYQANASWLMHSTVWAAIVGSASSGKYLLNGENGNILKDGAVALFLGKPVYLSEWAPTAATAATVSCLYGDFKAGYRIIDRSMLSFTVDDVSQMSNGLIRYTSRMRSDAKAVDATAIVSVIIKT